MTLKSLRANNYPGEQSKAMWQGQTTSFFALGFTDTFRRGWVVAIFCIFVLPLSLYDSGGQLTGRDY